MDMSLGDLHPYDELYNALLNQEDVGIQRKCAVLGILHDASPHECRLLPDDVPIEAVKVVLQAYKDACEARPDAVSKTIAMWLNDVKEHFDAAVS